MGCGSSTQLHREDESKVTSNGVKTAGSFLSGDRISLADARTRRESRCMEQQRRASMLAPAEVEKVRERRKSSCVSIRAYTTEGTQMKTRSNSWDGTNNLQKENHMSIASKPAFNLPKCPTITVSEGSFTPLSVRHAKMAGTKNQVNGNVMQVAETKLSYKRNGNLSLEEQAALVVQRAISNAVQVTSSAVQEPKADL